MMKKRLKKITRSPEGEGGGGGRKPSANLFLRCFFAFRDFSIADFFFHILPVSNLEPKPSNLAERTYAG